jgi:hypothetical protein
MADLPSRLLRRAWCLLRGHRDVYDYQYAHRFGGGRYHCDYCGADWRRSA